MKQVLNIDDVKRVMSDLVAQGKRPTLATLHAALDHRGSMSTLVRLKTELEAAKQPVIDSNEGLKAFRELWALTSDEGRKSQETVTADLRESLQALARENERLEGVAVAAHNRAHELEQVRSRAEAELTGIRVELNHAGTALVTASAQASDALQKLAQSQATHAAQLAGLQAEVAAGVEKAHDIELQLVRARALLEAKGVDVEVPNRETLNQK